MSPRHLDDPAPASVNAYADPSDRLEVTIVLWHGQYKADALGRADVLAKYDRALFGLRDVRVEGRPGMWHVIADAYVAHEIEGCEYISLPEG